MQIAYQIVKCKDCGKKYQCLPNQDYYHPPEMADADKTRDNGQCETCLLLGAGIHPDKIITEYPDGTVVD